MSSTVPCSPGRTTRNSSSRNTGTRAAASSSSTWGLPVRCSARVQRDAEVSDAVGLVEDHGIEVVGEAPAKELKYWNIFCTRGAPLAGDLAQGLGERPRPGGVQDRATLPRHLTEQGQRDHALAAPRAARDDHRGLGVGAPSPLDRVQDVVIGVALLIEEDEHLAALHLFGGYGERLLGRGDAAGEEAVGIRCTAHTGSEARLEELLGTRRGAGP